MVGGMRRRGKKAVQEGSLEKPADLIRTLKENGTILISPVYLDQVRKTEPADPDWQRKKRPKQSVAEPSVSASNDNPPGGQRWTNPWTKASRTPAGERVEHAVDGPEPGTEEQRDAAVRPRFHHHHRGGARGDEEQICPPSIKLQLQPAVTRVNSLSNTFPLL